MAGFAHSYFTTSVKDNPIPMKRKFLYFSFFLLFSSRLIAQSKLSKDYIVTQNSDTIQGIIEDKQWKLNPKRIKFKKEISDPSTVYTTSQLKGFYVSNSNEHYKSTLVSIDHTPYELSELITPKEIGRRYKEFLKTDSVFLRQLVQGKVNLFILNEGGSKTHFYIQKLPQDTIVELLYKRFLQETPMGTVGNNQIGVMEGYKQQLQEYFEDSPSTRPKINSTKYEETSLINLFNFYNGLAHPVNSNLQKVTRSRSDFYLLVGGTSSQLSFQTDETSPQYLNQVKFKSSFKPTINMGLDWIFPRLNQSWSWYNELGYRSFDFSDKLENNFINTIPGTTHITLQAEQIHFLSSARYRLSKGKLRPFVNAGLTVSLNLNHTDSLVHVVGPSLRFQRVTISDWKKQQLGWQIGCGIIYNRWIADFRYERSQGMSNDADKKTPMSVFYALIGYRFL